MTFDKLCVVLRGFHSSSLGQGASEEEIAVAEHTLGVSIRGDYRKFLRIFGWGGVGHFELYGLGADVPSYLNLVEMTQSERSEMRPRLPRTLLPLMNDGGGNHYCLDLRTEGPSVVFWDHEGGERQKPSHEAEGFTPWLEEMIRQLE